MTASTSTSTFHAGFISALTTTVVLAGRTSWKCSPWTRLTASKSALSTRYTRVRTTSAKEAPAASRASPMISKHRRACDLGVGLDAVVRPLRGRAGHEDPLRDAHGAAVADDELPRPTRRDQLPVRHGEATYRAGASVRRSALPERRSLSYGAAGGGPLASVSLDHDRGKRHGPTTQGPHRPRARDAERLRPRGRGVRRRWRRVVVRHAPQGTSAPTVGGSEAPSGSTGGGTEAPTTAAAATAHPRRLARVRDRGRHQQPVAARRDGLRHRPATRSSAACTTR